jgi:acrylyl-CoA reductase (NADPH)
MSTFKALVLEQTDQQISATVRELEDHQLPDGDVTVAVEYSSLNYKDGLALKGLGGLVKTYPHVPGIDYAGVVEHSEHADFTAGDAVIGTGFRVGEARWGGYAQKARVSGDWLVPLPADLTSKRAMGLGSAGLSAAIALQVLEDHGLEAPKGEVLITGASGGVGSFSVALLSALGYTVVAATGRLELSDYLKGLGASEIIARSELAEPTNKPLESTRWAACIDSVGGTTLARVLGQMQYGASVAAIGLAGGSKLETTVIPFLLRGINLLGIDSVYYPKARRITAWQRLAQTVSGETIDSIISEVGLEDLPRLGKEILEGKVKGRVVVNINTQ